jgi:hypothetical protein
MKSTCAAMIAACACLGAAPAAADPIKLGVRVDARPFAWSEQGPGSEGEEVFNGFLVRICTEAIRNAGFSYEQVSVTANERRWYIDPESGAEEPTTKVDVLCDPITLTVERLERLKDYDFTPIVFVANSSYVTKSGPPTVAAAKESGETLEPQTCRGADGTEHQREPGVTVDAGFLVGTTSEDTYHDALRRGLLSAGPGQTICSVEFSSHEEGMSQLCQGKIAYYFSDNDISAAYRDKYNSDRGLTGAHACALSYVPGFLRYEPYAILVRTEDSKFRRRFIRAVYGLFADKRTIPSAFEEFFHGRRASHALQMLFLINEIPSGKLPKSEASSASDPTEGDGGGQERQVPSQEGQPPPGASASGTGGNGGTETRRDGGQGGERAEQAAATSAEGQRGVDHVE